jgi:hypothetical protein
LTEENGAENISHNFENVFQTACEVIGRLSMKKMTSTCAQMVRENSGSEIAELLYLVTHKKVTRKAACVCVFERTSKHYMSTKNILAAHLK